MPPHAPAAPEMPFAGWRVVWAAFAVASFGWGVGFYGPPVFLFAVQEARGWSIPLVSAAVTSHFLCSAFIVGNLPALNRRFGLVCMTRAGGLFAALGVLGWALAEAPWQLFLATGISGAGWAMTGAAAINAMVSPWFIRRRPAALSTAYNGASFGGVVMTPLWAAAITLLGFPIAAALIGGAMVVCLWWLAGRFLRHGSAALGQMPDGAIPGVIAPSPAVQQAALPGALLWRSRRFVTLAGANAFGLFAQIGLISHLFSLLVAPMGAAWAGLAAALARVCAIIGRTGLGWLLPVGADRRRAAGANYGLQAMGSLVLLSAGDSAALLLLGIAMFGLGLGNATSLPPLIAQIDFAAADIARAVALLTALGQAAYAFAPACFGLLRSFSPEALFLAAALSQGLAVLAVLAGRSRTSSSG